jgi:flagellar L-ring protein precursor FlgH
MSPNLRKVVLLALAAHAALVLTGPTQAESIWERRDKRFANMFWDTNARRVGDLVTIVVRENTDIQNTDERDAEKKTRTRAFFNLEAMTEGNRGQRQAKAELDTRLETERKLEGTSDYSVDHRLADRMTVTVIDVQPNGNLLIEGYRQRVISGEVRLLRVTGLVRPADIRIGNQIESQFIANFQVQYVGRGPESSYSNPGWFGKIMDVLWPF